MNNDQIMVFSLISLFVLGACIGSFINALNYRYVKGKSMLGRSACPHCRHKLSPVELIPIISFLIQKGKCLNCKKPISPRYPLVETTAAAAFAFVGYFFWPSFVHSTDLLQIPYILFIFFFVASLIAVAAADFSWGIIPDVVIFPAIFITFVYKIYQICAGFFRIKWYLETNTIFAKYLTQPNSYFLERFMREQLIGLLYSVLLALSIAGCFYLLIRLTKGRAMGLGDVKLGFLVGLAVGWPAGIVSLFAAFLTGALASVMLILVRRKKFGGTVPFGPFLSIGAFIGLFYGNYIISLYLNLMR